METPPIHGDSTVTTEWWGARPHPKSFHALEFETLPTRQRLQPPQQGGDEAPVGFFSGSNGA